MLSIILIVLIAVFGSFDAQDESGRRILEHEGHMRGYWLHIPDTYDADQPGHLLMVLHGGGQTTQTIRQVTGRHFEQRIQEVNGLVVYPEGIQQRWNDGRVRDDGRETIDDSAFLLAVIDDIAAQYNIDPHRVFVAGFSNGAGMSYRLACEFPERIAVIAPVAALFASTLDCVPHQPVSILLIIGDSDPIVPLTGGDLLFDDSIPLGSVWSFDETVSLWTTANDCAEHVDLMTLPDNDPDDGTTVSIGHYQDCDAPVSIIMIHGGGHTWPGSRLSSQQDLYGLTSAEINAGDEIFDFMQAHGLGDDVPATSG